MSDLTYKPRDIDSRSKSKRSRTKETRKARDLSHSKLSGDRGRRTRSSISDNQSLEVKRGHATVQPSAHSLIDFSSAGRLGCRQI